MSFRARRVIGRRSFFRISSKSSHVSRLIQSGNSKPLVGLFLFFVSASVSASALVDIVGQSKTGVDTVWTDVDLLDTLFL
jgi:hypothetical protein